LYQIHNQRIEDAYKKKGIKDSLNHISPPTVDVNLIKMNPKQRLQFHMKQGDKQLLDDLKESK
jgi:hypothetical protein